MDTYLKKTLWFVLVPYAHRQSKKMMMSTLLIISICMQVGPLLRPKNLYYVQNTQLAQFIDKFLKIAEV